MKLNTNQYGFIYKKSNGKYTRVPYRMETFRTPSKTRKAMSNSSNNLRRSLKSKKLVRLVLETV